MKLLLDQGMPRGCVAWLQQSGHDVSHVADIGMAEADDREILDRGRQESQIIITHDADFHALLALSGATMPSVVRLRIEGLKSDECAGVVNHVLQLCHDDLMAGALVTALPTSVRVRRLPIISSAP